MYSIIEFDILDVELDFGASAPVVLFELVAEVKAFTTHASQAFAHLEGDGWIGHGAFSDGDGVELKMIDTYNAGVASIHDLAGNEDGDIVVGTEGSKLLEDAEELGGDLGETYLGVDLHFRHSHFGTHALTDKLFEALDEGFHILLPQRDAGSTLVTAKMFE